MGKNQLSCFLLTRYIGSWLNELKFELNNAEKWNELKHVLVRVIFIKFLFQAISWYLVFSAG